MASIYAIEQNKEGSIPASWQECNMASVPLFWNTKIDMAAIGAFRTPLIVGGFRFFTSLALLVLETIPSADRSVAVLADFRLILSQL